MMQSMMNGMGGGGGGMPDIASLMADPQCVSSLPLSSSLITPADVFPSRIECARWLSNSAAPWAVELVELVELAVAVAVREETATAETTTCTREYSDGRIFFS
jgi:hypothetical protein